MEFKLIMALIDKVSAAGIKSIEIEENGTHIKIKNQSACVSAAAEPIPPPLNPNPGRSQTAETETEEDFLYVKSPLVGIFCPLEDCGKPALNPGDPIAKKQVVCAIEAMKLINDVESTAEGVYDSTLVQPGDQVEFGQPLIRLRKG